MNREEGLAQITSAKWEPDSYEAAHWLNLRVMDEQGRDVTAILSLRPVYCDRGHLQLHIDGPLGLDGADCFPRFFFNMDEADHHVRTFLKWRIWKERTYPHTLEFNHS